MGSACEIIQRAGGQEGGKGGGKPSSRGEEVRKKERKQKEENLEDSKKGEGSTRPDQMGRRSSNEFQCFLEC